MFYNTIYTVLLLIGQSVYVHWYRQYDSMS